MEASDHSVLSEWFCPVDKVQGGDYHVSVILHQESDLGVLSGFEGCILQFQSILILDVIYSLS